jgi:hypothetical protein
MQQKVEVVSIQMPQQALQPDPAQRQDRTQRCGKRAEPAFCRGCCESKTHGPARSALTLILPS